MIVIVMIGAGISLLFVKSRTTAIILNSVLGYSVAFFFVVFRAPDLALTQIIVETVTTALFFFASLSCLNGSGNDSENDKGHSMLSSRLRLVRIVTILALWVQGNKLFESISVYFEDSYELAGGKNIVNTILGDFRAFDTMLEVVVLFIAGIGVFTLIKLKAGKGGKDVEDQ